MFILEDPYVSNLMLKTLCKNNFEVLDTQKSREWCNNLFSLNYISKDNALKKLDEEVYPKIYSNSENSINFVTENLKNSKLADIINVCKDKYEFRNRLMPIFPKFFFEEILLEDLESFDVCEIPMPFIIKPTVGFLSMGVHKVSSIEQWFDTVRLIKNEVKEFSENFPANVLNSSSFIIEEVIQGEEFAIDAFYNNVGEPVILNIFKHPFVSAEDVSDRVYISSKEIIEKNFVKFNALLNNIGELIHIKNFPIHIEVIRKANGEIIPVEINPMRFAGWCTADLAYYAYGINVYEYFENNLKPNWEEILKDKFGKIYYFAITENPKDVDCSKITINYEKLKTNFSNIFEFRQIDYRVKPVSAVLFGETQSYDEIIKILQLNMSDFIIK